MKGEWFSSDKYIQDKNGSCYPRGRLQEHKEDSISIRTRPKRDLEMVSLAFSQITIAQNP